METIIPSLITGIVTALGTILGFISTMKQQNRKANDELRQSLETKLESHKVEYLTEISSVRNQIQTNTASLAEMKAQTEKWQSNYEIKMDNLIEKVNKHNNFMEKLQQAQLDIEVLKNRESVSEHRLADLERLNEKA